MMILQYVLLQLNFKKAAPNNDNKKRKNPT